MNAAMPAIAMDRLTKAYKERQVLKGVGFSVPRGSIFALLGSNGAGKTTIVKILATLLRPDSGSARICGWDLLEQPGQVRRHISLTGQFAAVDELLTGRENLRIIGALRHLPDGKEQAEALLGLFRLQDAAHKPVSTYSGGMRRRLDIAMSLMGHAPVVFLDEPTAGLDPQNRLGMWEIIRSMKAAGTTVFLTTQYLDEAEALADHIAVLHRGVIHAQGTPDQLKAILPQGGMYVAFSGEETLHRATDLLAGYRIRREGEETALYIQTDGGAAQFAQILQRLIQGGVEIRKFAPAQPTLEDAFLTLIDEKKEECIHG